MKSSWSERLARQQAWNVSSIPPQPFFPLPPLVEFCGTSIPKLEQEISDYALVHLADHPPHRLEGPCIVFDEGGSKPVYVNDDRFVFFSFSFSLSLFLFLFFFFFFYSRVKNTRILNE